MRIVIDLQGAQAENRKRGIGRYSLSIAKAIARSRGEHDVILVLNGRFSKSVQFIRDEFSDLLPRESIRVWYSGGGMCHLDPDNEWRRRAGEFTREAFLASLNPSVVLMTSLFEGLVDDATTSIGSLTQVVPTTVILYDLIPLIHSDHYLRNPAVYRWYEDKLGHLRRAEMVLSISESSRQEAITHLGLPQDKVTNISAAYDEEKFQPKELAPSDRHRLQQRYGIQQKFVMYTGGMDHRKNIDGLIRSYARVSERIRGNYQLAIVCGVEQEEKDRLQSLAEDNGLNSEMLVFTGYVPDEDLVSLYNACAVFVFPSWHEGFGLPALEAMACGRAVVAASTSSLPEVVGCEDALFDPFDEASIARKIEQVLTDEIFRNRLEVHGIERAANFSWEKTAQLTISKLEYLYEKNKETFLPVSVRPRLAYISPLPPERTGIADYSAELLPELSRFYEIDVVVNQDLISSEAVKANFPIRSVDWFRKNQSKFDRVLYHFGNSEFHQHMFELLGEIPGIVVLHDFYLSGILSYMEQSGRNENIWMDELYYSHGYLAVWSRFDVDKSENCVWDYPCNRSVVEAAKGVIVHSEYSQRLAKKWYSDEATINWSCIPLLRKPIPVTPGCRNNARVELNIAQNSFVICSFGLLGQSKLNDRLIKAWINSPMAYRPDCLLIFVGELSEGRYADKLKALISKNGRGNNIRITGWVDSDEYKRYLFAADAAVQLRTLSRGETSAAILDCMNAGLPTIINANGSMVDLPDDCTVKIQDEFSDSQLTEVLLFLWQNNDLRREKGRKAREHIIEKHVPSACAMQYYVAIEKFESKFSGSTFELAKRIGNIDCTEISMDELSEAAASIDISIKAPTHQKQLLIDISELVRADARTGIQRVVKKLLHELLSNPIIGYRVEPVYADEENNGYRYARKFTLKFLGLEEVDLPDDPISFYSGDFFLGLDLQPSVVISQKEFYDVLLRQGVEVRFVVYDLLPIQHPEFFVEGAQELYHKWLSVVTDSNGAVCISQTVANELKNWVSAHKRCMVDAYSINWFHLGADLIGSISSRGMPDDVEGILCKLESAPTFLMVGTIEPRKGHKQVIDAFEHLWSNGCELNLVIVGKQGWLTEQLVQRIKKHSQLGSRLFWFSDASDELLDKLFRVCDSLIAASFNEGFGLPLIEAAQHGLPIICRNIPVFREVAGNYAFYFDGERDVDLADSITKWLAKHESGCYPESSNISWLTWEQSSLQLKHVLTEGTKGNLISD